MSFKSSLCIPSLFQRHRLGGRVRVFVGNNYVWSGNDVDSVDFKNRHFRCGLRRIRYLDKRPAVHRRACERIFEKILRQAGAEPWERLLQNLRASRETGLAKLYPLQFVTAWLGNTPMFARESYLQCRDADFEKVAQIPAQQTSESSEMCRILCHMEMNNPLFHRQILQNKGFSILIQLPD